MEDAQKQIEELKNKLASLERVLSSHEHKGNDGSSRIEGNSDINANTVNLVSGPLSSSSTSTTPFNIYENLQNLAELTGRRVGSAATVVSGRDTVGELDQLGIVVGKDFKSDNPKDLMDFTKFNQTETILIHQPNGDGFFIGEKTPIVNSPSGDGTLAAPNTLTSATQTWATNSLAGCFVNVFNSSTGAYLEGQFIASNTSNVITTFFNWTTAPGTYTFQVLAPVYLGLATVPWRRINLVGDVVSTGDYNFLRVIRFGLGPTAGSQGIFYGNGDPNGSIASRPGSVYLNFNGGAGTTLYIKESGSGTSGWVGK